MLLGTGRFFGQAVGGATVPAQFGTGDWSVADAHTSGDITITITVLPDDGGSAIIDLEYQIDGGSWVSLGGTTTGDYPVAGLTDDVEVDVAIRAVNAVGPGVGSATKAVTPTAPAPAITVENTDERVSSTSVNPSFATVAFGSDESGRHVFVSYFTSKNGGALAPRPTAMTIGGVSAVLVAERQSVDAAYDWCQIWAAAPSGTSGTIAITGGGNRHAICVYKTVNVQSLTATSIGSGSRNSSGAISAPVDSLAGGAVFCVYGSSDNAATPSVSGGLSEDYTISAGTVHRSRHLHKLSASAETVTASHTDSTSSERTILAAAMR